MAALWSRSRQKTSDDVLIRALYEEHGRALLGYAQRLTGDLGAAEDIVQETLIRAWRHPESLVNGKGSVRGWLLTVARNIVTDRYRARAARPTEVAESPSNGPVEQDHAEAVVDSMVVMEALDQLSPDHREVLKEIYFQGRTVAEAAQALGIPAGTVKSRSHYALKALRELYTEKPRTARLTVVKGAVA
ncbi:sigma-70 family RNA polymerase sigma factor [Streptomyces clavuligerus]|uniref:Putative RNA polymerase sigma factor n=1 Tax=Streptomyces clavuligerus TaxID=1901 RepID=B2LX16_STRCL|nr:sigma-70 family RNA polymerase sigma factor [Streptomyces clavuligerus]ACB72856.1 putative RNA polymerase sigma factor [Streptomyces clavuligerus]ANW18157.1 RNA polymerase [Streptomyces clavuligerus]AXU12718.1 sigma-70 family RNA polymerase sigma factor [Streptomyces clavuligerus]EFG09248.1 RNA polymerase, sigma-24 subunit, ECF subfamily [Streptomyces clavuligerus]MBY6302622.1 sigma-70 family RNA polymerase sigma factor [Streptomyces clavuligerus]